MLTPTLNEIKQTVNGLIDKITHKDSPEHAKKVWSQAVGVCIEQIELHYGSDAKLF